MSDELREKVAEAMNHKLGYVDTALADRLIEMIQAETTLKIEPEDVLDSQRELLLAQVKLEKELQEAKDLLHDFDMLHQCSDEERYDWRKRKNKLLESEASNE